MIYREHYIKMVREFYDSDLVKIITGVRRCGKSVILQQIAKEVREKSENVIMLNFEDKQVSANIGNARELLEYVEEKRKSGKCYIFLDEVQMLEGWQEACRTLRLHNNSLFITGSNSKLLSGEFTKELSGRYVAFKVMPFVYREAEEYANELGRECTVTDYLVWGGMPQRFEFETEEAQRRYLNDLDETIVVNDLINRYSIRKKGLFRGIVNFVLRSNGRVISAKSVCDYIKGKNEGCTVNTVIKYLGHLEEAYIIERVSPYSQKAKEELRYYMKVYDEDVAFNSIRCPDNRYDLSHNMENVVYNELLYKGYSVSVFNNRGREIDFLAQKGNKRYYIQVAYSVAEEKAYEREFSAFEKLDNTAGKIIITTDEIDYSTAVVRHIKLKDFLQMETLD